MNYLTTKKIAASKFQPNQPIALGDAPSGPVKEDNRDRSVTLNLKFSVTIEDLYLLSDDWTHRLEWDDIIGVDTADHSKSIDRINIEMTAWGAPRYWILGGDKRVPVMPAEIPVRLRSRSPVRAWGYSTILKPKWVGIPMKGASAPFTQVSDVAGLARIADTFSGQRAIGRLQSVINPRAQSLQ